MRIAIVKMKYFITMSPIGGSESSNVTRIIHQIPSTTAMAFVAFFAYRISFNAVLLFISSPFRKIGP